MPARTGRTTYVPGRGSTTRSKSGKAKTYSGSGSAPAGTTKVKEKTYSEVPTVTVSSSGGSTKVVASNYGSKQAARRAEQATQRRQRRIRAILNTDLSKPQKRSETVTKLKSMDRPLPGPRKSRSTSHLDDNPQTAVISSYSNPKAKPETFRGMKTAGEPIRSELQAAAKQGTLKVNKQGFATTPKARQVAGKVKKLESKARKAGGPLPGLDPEQTHVARRVLSTGRSEGANYKELLAAAETGLVESDFRNLNYGDADSQGWRQERSMYYPNPTNVKASAKRFFTETKTDTGGARGRGQTAGQLAQTVQASAFPDRYDERKPEANAIVKAFVQGQASPQLQAKLEKAQTEAKRLGLRVGKAAPDLQVDPRTRTIKVRADAQGMVKWAEATVGTTEGSAKHLRWAGKTGLGGTEPWCASFISNGLLRRGIKNLPSNPNYVPSYESEWSQYAVPGGLAKAKPGDIVTFSGSHIGLYVGGGEMISGNSSDAVSRTPVGSPSMVIRPPYKGGFVRVKESTALPGSTAVTTTSSSAPAAVGLVAAPAAEGEGRKTGKPKLSHRQKMNRTNRKLRALSLPKGQPGPTSSVLDNLERKYGAAVV